MDLWHILYYYFYNINWTYEHHEAQQDVLQPRHKESVDGVAPPLLINEFEGIVGL